MALSTALQRAYNRKPTLVPRKDSSNNPNPYYRLNLPPDYPSLTTKEKRDARLNGVLLQGPDPYLFQRAWDLFRTYYLMQLPEGVFYKGFIPSPPCHYDAVRDLAQYQLNAWAFPRGSGKSTVLGKEVPLLLACTRPNFDVLAILSKDEFVQKRFSTFMQMFEDNDYMLSDFGGFKPPRGAKVYNHHLVQMTNGSSLQGMAVEGKMLGERPDLILPDDPEHDKAMVANPNPTALREAFEKLLFGTLLPMMREGSCAGWIGTLLDTRSFLYEVMHSNDPRYKFWNRRVLAGMQEDGSSLWPAKWSKAKLDLLREMWGESYFQTHMQNSPGSGASQVLHLHNDYGQYWVDNEDDDFGTRPLYSNAEIKVIRPVKKGTGEEIEWEGSEVVRPFGEWSRSLYRILCVDFAFNTTQRSDFSCAHVMGFENSESFRDTLYSLDMWMGKKSAAEVVKMVLHLAYKWQVRIIAPEAITIQQQLVDQIAAGADLLREETGWAPAVVPVRYPANLKKAHRIGALEWRFNKFRVKLPADRRDTWPYKELYRQIERFTEDMRQLPFDDAVDTLAMHQFVGRPRSRGAMADAGEKPLDPIEALKAGELVSEAGIPWITALQPNEAPLHDMIVNMLEQKERDGDQGGTKWKSPGQIS